MKTMKKTLSLVLAIVMALALAVPAYAADDYTLTVNNTVPGHTYTAYQIFKGTKADKTQVSYDKLADNAEFVDGTTYYVKDGADYSVADVTAENFADKKSTLYTRNGNSGLGDVVWGSDITKAGKQALYTAYEMTVDADKLDDAANIQALIAKIADVKNTTASESDKAVKFANVFFKTVTADNAAEGEQPGDVVAKEGLLGTPATKQVQEAAESTTSVTFSELASGYYLVNDSYSKEGEVNGIDYSIARIAVQVVGNTTINNKADKPEVKKTIKTVDELKNEKANELGLGRIVEYTVTEKVPNYDGYNYYYYVMRDKLSGGLTFDPDSVVVTVGGVTLTKLTAPNHSQDGKGYYLYADKTKDTAVLGTGENADTFVIAFENIMNFTVGDPIVVTYNASVNSNAITGVNPNTNEVKVDYSNDPSKSEQGDIDNHPGVPLNDENHPTGTTPSSFTNTYTTMIKIHKTDKDGNDLKGVEFTLTGTSKDVVVKNEVVYAPAADGTYYLLKNGTYTEAPPRTTPTLTETTGNSGWVKDKNYAGTDARRIGDDVYRPFVLATDQNLTRYVIVEPNDNDYASLTVRYKPTTVTSEDPTLQNYNVTRVAKTNDEGVIEFKQLGAGTYTLSETEVLPGYNDIADITFTIECTPPAATSVTQGTETAQWTLKDGSVSPDTAATMIVPEKTKVTGENGQETEVLTGNFVITIQNNKGTELPSTGGIGTKIFYTMGAVLVIGAGVILVSRKRAGE